jgi:hypothetical protein
MEGGADVEGTWMGGGNNTTDVDGTWMEGGNDTADVNLSNTSVSFPDKGAVVQALATIREAERREAEVREFVRTSLEDIHKREAEVRGCW